LAFAADTIFTMATQPGEQQPEPIDATSKANPSDKLAKGVEAVTVCDTPTDAAIRAAAWVSGFLQTTITQRGSATFAVSGGSTPAAMFSALSGYDIDWRFVHLFQVDERLALKDSADRNLTQLQQRLIDFVAIPPANVHPMPVDDEMAPDARAHEYERTLARFAPNGIDLVHLGLGSDGHTASLLPGDPGLGVTDRAVTFTSLYKGFRRLTLTHPELSKAHSLLWLITGIDKAIPLKQLLRADTSIPAGQVRNRHQTIFCDAAAATVSRSEQLIDS
jgi:6-phosphogluconolactonase